MSSRSPKIPSYCLHKATGQAVVRLNGKDVYLGVHGTPASQEAYRRLVAEWLAAGNQGLRSPPTPSQTSDRSLSIDELVLAYWAFVQGYYVKHGKPTSEQDNVHQALRF